MGVRNVLPPEESPVPLMSLERARRGGLDVSKIRTCAVPQKAGDVFLVKGCTCAHKCSQAGFGLVHLGGFGPQPGHDGRPVPGAGGEGPENVPYYRYDSASRTEKEDYMPCYSWFVGVHDQYEQQRATGDIIEILGRERNTKIAQLVTLPADPNANKTGNSKMNENVVVEYVPGFRQTDGASPRMEYALAMRRNRQQQAALAPQRMGPGPTASFDEEVPPEVERATGTDSARAPEGPFDLEMGVPPVAEGIPVVAEPVVSARQVGRPSRKPKDED